MAIAPWFAYFYEKDVIARPQAVAISCGDLSECDSVTYIAPGDSRVASLLGMIVELTLHQLDKFCPVGGLKVSRACH